MEGSLPVLVTAELFHDAVGLPELLGWYYSSVKWSNSTVLPIKICIYFYLIPYAGFAGMFLRQKVAGSSYLSS